MAPEKPEPAEAPAPPPAPLVENRRDSEPPREASGWARRPGAESTNGSAGGGAAARAAAVKNTAEHVWRSTAGVRAAIRGGAVKVTSEMGERFQKATDALEAPADAELDGLYSSADLPALDIGDPIASLVARLDRESDFFRGLALRALARAGWADRIAQGSGLLMGLGAAALAVIAALGALFGAEGAAARVFLISAALGALVVGAALVTMISGSIRRAQREIARDALERADLVEIRLHRIGIVSAILQTDEVAGRRALDRLERDVSVPPR